MYNIHRSFFLSKRNTGSQYIAMFFFKDVNKVRRYYLHGLFVQVLFFYAQEPEKGGIGPTNAA